MLILNSSAYIRRNSAACSSTARHHPASSGSARPVTIDASDYHRLVDGRRQQTSTWPALTLVVTCVVMLHQLLVLGFSSSKRVEQTGAFAVTAHRPPPSSWKRTLCGSPSGAQPARPAEPYQLNVDHPGADIPPCGSEGCVLGSDATHESCEAKCNSTNGCYAYVFAPSNCSGQSGPICWTKSAAGGGGKPNAQCRNSRQLATPATKQADIPSKWAAEVTADTTPLTAYPRPQMVRGGSDRDKGDPSVWTNLNGLWEWASTTTTSPPFGKTLGGSILVPFPVESCLSGVAPPDSASIVKQMWYRLVFDASSTADGGKTLLHFGAVDWQASVYLNGALLGNHTGGYDGFSFEVSLKPSANELLVYVFDPSDAGAQPNGKQRISAIDSPGGDTYTPSSGIWQTVWLEAVPSVYIASLKIDQAFAASVDVTVRLSSCTCGAAAATKEEEEEEGGAGADTPISLAVVDAAGKTVSTGTATCCKATSLAVPDAQLWSPTSPYLYGLEVSLGSAADAALDKGGATLKGGADAVLSYFGLRTFALGDGPKGKRPLLNGNFTFLAGFLDQSWWPDGQYTAPTDDALAYDVTAVPMFGLNMIRLHQKVNPERWYWHADRTGVVVFQDMVQKYGGATNATVPLFVADFEAMVTGPRGNHPCIVQYTTFNEGDCWRVFDTPPHDVAGIVALSRQLDPKRPVDTDSGGPENNLHIGAVNDIHSYPYPGDPQPSATQYAMIGEFGGIGAFVEGKEWKPKSCHTYLHVDTPHDEAATYVNMSETIAARVDHISASVYTQTTDVELECDGFLNYDRTNKFSAADTEAIRKANQAIIQQAAAA